MVYWPFSMLKEKALKAAIGHVHYEDENSRYLCIGSVENECTCIAVPIKMYIYIYISMQDHGWQVSDCTAKGLKVMPQLYQNT
jgi:hypothetical protein